ncbi:MAG TPA: DNA polymerase III subunit gamma/tau [Candidatus Microsaccharimonas sp.]|nr:DNA polymerase III subunit gamma/tau [Candidatus Microsaccharimonas sp.]
MGQALYRKYRSRSLDEIVGQEHITETLAKALKSGRLSHAYLFTGPRGVGKTSIARILAHEINGLPYDEQQTPIDIIEIDAASNRRIDEIRELRDKIHVAPAAAKYKVYIIDEVHMLTREAFNALLKTLEEPPEHAIFILATTEAHKLPETIVSRTQRYVFRPIEPGKAVAHLRHIADTEKIAVSDEALELIAEHGNGSFRDSISLLDQLAGSGKKIDVSTVQRSLGIAPAEAVHNLLDAIRSGDSRATYQQLTTLIEQGNQAATIAKQLAQQLRVALRESSDASTQDVQLLNSLLEVPLSHDQEAALEVALLAYGAVSQIPQVAPSLYVQPPIVAKPETVAAPAPVKPTHEAKKATTTAVLHESTDEAVAAPAAQLATDKKVDVEAWQALLDSLKKKHNTLYGIVRMAQPDFSQPGVLQLAFSFAFHQKRANEAKNRQLISDYLAAATGAAFEIICTYDPEASAGKLPERAPEAIATPATAENGSLSAISNIFGGVEMVE